MNFRMKLLTLLLASAGLLMMPPCCLAASIESPSAGTSGAGAAPAENMNIGGGVKQALKHAWQGTAKQVNDAAVTTKVKALLLADKTTQKSTIHVSTNHGTVTLSGKVPSVTVAQRAQMLAKTVEGVKHVDNELKFGIPNR